ncbi:CCA tRNA nucleotidyltransferase, partial [Patulibacter sp. NPDC049589]
PPVAGDVLAASLGLRPGPELGRLLRRIAIAHDAGLIGTAAEATDLAARLHAAGPETAADAG